ncbi:Aldo/keto reductase [Periconia macrospinosa]|uniref:Aldo/keto reductase n=1 Tax=Periconia macrospinosa TaxID=97972 RepID=A0A2V1DXK2_9PLEO|nr:Aldo/keto reductase [Periconia macrospinosa]
MAFPPPPKPKSLLGRHRILAPSAGVKVSPICLGAMNFGDKWASVLGECNKEQSFAMLDYFYSQGGNFIDTAVNYQEGESEQWLGDWMEQRGNRDEMIIATKFTGSQVYGYGDKVIHSNYGGNSAKNIHTSITRSLKNLRTSYIDIYYVHLLDYTTSLPELMHALNTLITSGRVLYLGISNAPAWVVVKANDYARENGLRPFSVYQGQWSVANRDMERDIIPMCLHEGMAIAPWQVLGGGGFKANEGGRTSSIGRVGTEAAVGEVLSAIAEKRNPPVHPTNIALAYVMHKAPYVFPILGGRKLEHMKSNIEALSLKLSGEEMSEMDNAYGFKMGFPYEFLNPRNTMVLGPEDVVFSKGLGTFDYVAGVKAIEPHQGGDDDDGVRPMGETE